MIDMSKKEFMDQLREGLDGNVSYEKYCETIEYYESYFRRKLAEGKTEEEILRTLSMLIISAPKKPITMTIWMIRNWILTATSVLRMLSGSTIRIKALTVDFFWLPSL